MIEGKKIVIVGGGISGLITTNLLSQKGFNVILIEKNIKCGGLVNSFEKDGFIFDGGIRAIENAGMMIPMIEKLGLDLTLLQSKVSLGIEDKVIHVENEESIKDYDTLLKDTYPESIDDVDKVIKIIKDFNGYMKVLFGSDSPFYKDKNRDKKYFISTFFIWLLRFLKTGIAISKMKGPVENFLHTLISDDSLFDIISQHFFKNTPTFFAMSYFSLYPDYYYPKGGVGQFTEELEKKAIKNGATIIKNSEICNIDLEKQILFDINEKQYYFDKLVWCANLKTLYNIIKIKQIPKKHQKKVRDERNKILSSKGAESVFTVFLEVNEDPSFYSKICHGHFFYTPSKKGLGSLHRNDLNNLLLNFENLSKEEIKSFLSKLCTFNTFEISIPALNDPNTSPKGKTGIIISFLMDYELVYKIEKKGWYKEFKEYIENIVIKTLNDSIFPQLNEKTFARFSSSPLTIQKTMGNSEGAIVGWSFEKKLPINAGMMNMKNSIYTSINNIYKAGQWTVSPAGLPTSIMTAKMVSDEIIKSIK